MNKFLALTIVALVFFNCKEEKTKVDANFVINSFKKKAKTINKVAYNMHRIDTFVDGEAVWNHKGYALIEQHDNDFSFYAKNNSVPNYYMYDNGNLFEIDNDSKSITVESGRNGLGSPGGQMVLQNIFHLDSVYKSINLKENENSYVLKYKFEDDTIYNVKDKVKTIELSKDNNFPIKVTSSYVQLGKRTSNQSILSNIKFNDEIETSISEIKSNLKNYKLIQESNERPTHTLLGKTLPDISLPELFNEKNKVNLKSDQLTLIDFWEVWCGPCIASFSKVEKLKNKYPKLKVLGVVTENKETAQRLIEEKQTSFINLLGDKDTVKQFHISSRPMYFLVDKKGLIINVYYGFSDAIEDDISKHLNKDN